jgi:hypothetical protein
MRANWLSNRIFPSYRTILDHCCAAWNRLIDQPWTIMSIGLRDWLMGSDQRDLVLPAFKGSVSSRASQYRSCSRTRCTAELRGFQDAQHG